MLLISSDMPEMVAVADRILVMHGFRIVGEVANDHRYETTSKAIMGRIHAVEDTEQADEALRHGDRRQAGKLAEYKRLHAAVWPESAPATEAGANYSIFQKDERCSAISNTATI